MGASIAGALVSGGLSYLGASRQASAAEANAARNEALQREQQEYYERQVGPGVDYARQVFSSGVPSVYTQPQYDAAGYASGLGQYYAAGAIPEYERGRRLEDAATAEAYRRSQITPQQIAQEQLGLAQAYRNPYQQAVIDAGTAAIQADFNRRAQDQAQSLAQSGGLASTIAGHRQAALEGARASAIGTHVSQQQAQAYNQALDRATAAQGRGIDLRGSGATALGQTGAAAAARGQQQAQAAIAAGETAGQLGLQAAYAPAREYLGVVQAPTSGRPRVTAVDRPTTDPLTYGAGIGLQTYYDQQRAQDYRARVGG